MYLTSDERGWTLLHKVLSSFKTNLIYHWAGSYDLIFYYSILSNYDIKCLSTARHTVITLNIETDTLQCSALETRAQLFKANDVVS